MALLHSDGFDSHGSGSVTLADGDSSWGAQTGVTVASGEGRYGGKALKLPADTAGSLAVVVSPGGTSLAVAAHLKAATSSNTQELLSDTAGPLLERTFSGALRVRDGAGVERISVAAALPDDTWRWVEVVYGVNLIELWVDGEQLSTYAGSYTTPSWATLAVFGGGGAGDGAVWVDDLLVWDDSGSYFNTFGLLPRRIQLLETDAAGSYTDWTPLGSDPNWESVKSNDWTGGDGVQATEENERDSYVFTGLSAAPGLIDAVVLKARVESTGGDPAGVQFLGVLGVDSTSATIPVPVSPAVVKAALYTDSNAVGWTSNTVQEAEFGLNLVSNGV